MAAVSYTLVILAYPETAKNSSVFYFPAQIFQIDGIVIFIEIHEVSKLVFMFNLLTFPDRFLKKELNFLKQDASSR